MMFLVAGVLLWLPVIHDVPPQHALSYPARMISSSILGAIFTFAPTIAFPFYGDAPVACGTMGLPTATVRLKGPDGKLTIQAAVGTGPVDACYKAIDAIVQSPATLLEFAVHAITEGIDALGEVTVRIEAEGGATPAVNAQRDYEQVRTFGGHGADTDIIVASVKAYLAALNKMLVATGQYTQKPEMAAVLN